MINFNKRYLLILVFFSLLSGILFVSLLRNKSGKNKQLPKPTLIPTKINQEKPGILTIKTKDNKTIFAKNNPFVIYIIANSNNQSITGYDAVLNYEEEKVDLIGYKELQSDFHLFLRKSKNQLMFSAVKKITSNNPVSFSDSPLIELTFQPKKSGLINFSFDFSPQNQKDSNLINDKTEDILGKIEGVKIYIGETITLNKNQPFFLPDKNTSLKLIEITTDNNKLCRDCLSKAKIEIKKNNQKKEIEFKIGGFAGYLVDKQEGFGHYFKLENFNENSVTLTYYEK